MAGPFVRRRNAMLLSVVSYFFVALIASFIKDFPILIFLEIIAFGIFFTMLGVYGLRLASVGGFTLVSFSIFIDGQFIQDNIWKSVFTFSAGCLWFFIVFLVSLKMQPYKLAGQMIGQNYLQLANYLKTKAKFYTLNPDFEAIHREMITQQAVIKNLQEDTREIVFKTRIIVNEATTTSRILMLMFLNSIDLFDKLLSADIDYQKIHQKFGKEAILQNVFLFLIQLSDELNNLGIALQSGNRTIPKMDITKELDALYHQYFELRNKEISSHRLEDFIMLRIVLSRTKDVANSISLIHKIHSQELEHSENFSLGLDYSKFSPKQEKLDLKVFLNNFSLKSTHFRHAIRITLALLLGYGISKFEFLGIGHSYWILITTIAIMRPAYSTTKHRNKLRIYGTISGAVIAYSILIFINDDKILLGILFISMIACFSLLTKKYSWAIFFMTIYIFIAFNFLKPGNVNLIFKDRILDTLIAGVIAFLVSHFVLPIWEHSRSLDFMTKSIEANLHYFKEVVKSIHTPQNSSEETFRMKRKDAIINLANLSDHFQRMLSDPKNKQEKLELVHQFVTTSHLFTTYAASLSQYSYYSNHFEEIDWEVWQQKISSEMNHTLNALLEKPFEDKSVEVLPNQTINQLLSKRKIEIETQNFNDIRDPNNITRLTKLKNIQELLELLSEISMEQKKIAINYKKIG